MKFIIDVNLTPDWIAYLQNAGVEAIHWSTVGPIDASDHDIMRWARDNDRIVLTNDLDFGTNLALSGNMRPSVAQLRTSNTLPAGVGQIVVQALFQAEADLLSGALLTIEQTSSRIRALPFG